MKDKQSSTNPKQVFVRNLPFSDVSTEVCIELPYFKINT